MHNNWNWTELATVVIYSLVTLVGGFKWLRNSVAKEVKNEINPRLDRLENEINPRLDQLESEMRDLKVETKNNSLAISRIEGLLQGVLPKVVK